MMISADKAHHDNDCLTSLSVVMTCTLDLNKICACLKSRSDQVWSINLTMDL